MLHVNLFRWPRPAAHALTFAVLMMAAAVPATAKPAWDQVANIKRSALFLAELQKSRGAGGTYTHIANCYRTLELGSRYGEGFESCLVLDYIHSKVTAAVYSKLPAAERQKMGVPEPEQLMRAMSQRLASGFAQYKIPQADARAFVGLVEKYGVPAFSAARFGHDGEGAPEQRQ